MSSLDKVLEGISIRPLFSERCSVSHCGEVTQSKPVLHAFVPARHLLLFGLKEGFEKHRHQTSAGDSMGFKIRVSITSSHHKPTITN